MHTDIVEASEFPDLARQYNVYAVTKTVINETGEIVGALPEPDFVRALVEAINPPVPPAAAG